MQADIWSDREMTMNASEYIYNNRALAYIGTKGGDTYYNVNGIVWSVWHDGCGNYPITNFIRIEDFNL
jgi:hypothetical protein